MVVKRIDVGQIDQVGLAGAGKKIGRQLLMYSFEVHGRNQLIVAGIDHHVVFESFNKTDIGKGNFIIFPVRLNEKGILAAILHRALVLL